MATTAAELLKTELEQGHFENYAELGLQNEAPKIYILRTGEKRKYMNQGINLTNETYSPEYTFAGTKLVTDPTAFMEG